MPTAIGSSSRPAHTWRCGSWAVFAVLGGVLLLAAACDAATSDGPVGSGGLTFEWSTYRKLATGSDNWPLTWCEDGHQYTSWGDGGGFGGSNEDGRVSLGFARLEGSHPNFTAVNVWGGKNAENPATVSGKVESMLCINGILYALRSRGSNDAGFDYKEVMRSTDKGSSWSTVSGSRLVGNATGAPGLPFYI
ncbi:MAG: hypothetical protein OER90_21120, partial [Gemmatimonadota bacterium]|nr:hypothetical protein [Gemmatimonadota bacterium]